VTTDAEAYERALRDAERELAAAATADDVRSIWRKHFTVLGHRALGRLLVGRKSSDILAKRSARSGAD
jgi:hypothetical protein